MDTGAALGGTGLFISIAGIIYSAVNHKHIKSRCCGKVYEVALDIEDTSRANITSGMVGNEKEGDHNPPPQLHNIRKIAPFPLISSPK
jgi:hypothetical protein